MRTQIISPEIAHKHLAEMRATLHADDFNHPLPEYLKAKILYTAKSLKPAGRSLSALKIQEIRELLSDLEQQLNEPQICHACKSSMGCAPCR